MGPGVMARVAGMVLALVLVASCGEQATSEPEARTPTSTTPAASTSAEPWAPLPGPLGRCGPQPARLSDVRFRTTTVRSDGRVMPAVVAGQGSTVVVLLHQTDDAGWCGWLSFAARVAAVPGHSALAFDLCGYGEAKCRAGSSSAAAQVEQVSTAIDAAERSGARRIVLVGASMGGSLAVLTAAVDGRVDAAVDLSGPDRWREQVVHERAAEVKVPLLVAMAADEGDDAVTAARRTADAAPDGEFVGVGHGHGHALLEDADGEPTALSDEVLAWITAH